MSFQIHVPDHILLEDEYILVMNKPAGLMVEPDRNGHPNLLQQVQKYLKSKAHPNKEIYVQHVHRLDRPVSGIVLFAKKKSALHHLSDQFAQRKVKKYYTALTDKAPKNMSGTLENYLWKDKKNKKAVIVEVSHLEAEKVSLKYDVIPQADSTFLWKIELHTGKYHQIRAQLAASGCPIIGDFYYGSTIPLRENEIALKASELHFLHPAKNELIKISL